MIYFKMPSAFLTIFLYLLPLVNSHESTTISMGNVTCDTEHRGTTKRHHIYGSILKQDGGKLETDEQESNYKGIHREVPDGISSSSNIIVNIRIIYRIFIWTFGFVCNTFSFLIITQQGLIKRGIWVYIAALAFCDNVAIIIDSLGMINEFSDNPEGYLEDFKANSEVLCKLLYFLFIVPWATGHYLLAIMSCERCLLILNPYRTPPSPKRALLVVCALILVMVIGYGIVTSLVMGIIHVEMPYLSSSNRSFPVANGSASFRYCYIKEIPNIFFYLDATLYLIIPMILIIIANICIITTLIVRAKNSSIHQYVTKVNGDRKITRMLIFVTVYFVLTASPNALYGVFLWPYFYENVQEAFAYDNVIFNLLQSLYATNMCSNFFIIVASGKIFRKEAKAFIWKILPKHNRANPPVQLEMSTVARILDSQTRDQGSNVRATTSTIIYPSPSSI